MYSKDIKQLAMSGSKGGDRKEHRKVKAAEGRVIQGFVCTLRYLTLVRREMNSLNGFN